jgi:regulator of PEP synthase PpsR (kinase-PPPase family)
VEELREARRLFRERAWTVVDISGRAVEENAARILELYESIHS